MANCLYWCGRFCSHINGHRDANLGDRGDLSQPNGQKIVAILLFEDLLIVPLLAIVAFMSPIKWLKVHQIV
jgi:Kef-type K+ transport system membrane component KefB